MKKKMLLFWQESCAHAVLDVTITLRANFPFEVSAAGIKEPPAEAFDTARSRYDALYLLGELECGSPALWLLSEDISYAGYEYLYGACLGNAAVVSSARTGYGENLHKEICHEAGHLSGLEHCPNPCVMNTSPDKRRLFDKPMIFCADCSWRLNKEKLR